MELDCKQCPHVVGDTYERDCCFPDCVGGWESAFNAASTDLLNLKYWIEIAGGIHCPNCDNSGGIVIGVDTYESGCCGELSPNGECCGNAVAVPVQGQEFEQCQFCHECPDSVFNRSQEEK